jgi:hypothetical protein
MTNIMAIAIVALAAWSAASHARAVAGATQAVPPAQEPSAPGARTPPASDGLRDLDAMTFGCPRAALNAAAREAAKVPAQGTYQFSYFRIASDSHHSSYEVHFKSNYQGEADLKYCVAIYCQQGWDPKTAKTSVNVIGKAGQSAGAASHGADSCSTPAPAKSPTKPPKKR